MNPVVIVGVTLAALATVFWFRSRTGFYRVVFSGEHYTEFAKAFSEIRAHAIAKREESSEAPVSADDSRVFITSVGLRVFYTISHDTEEGYEHHLSMSVDPDAKVPMTHGLSSLFAAYMTLLLGAVSANPYLWVSQNGVAHLVYALSPEDMEAFLAREVAVPAVEERERVHREIIALRERLFRSPSPPPM